MRALVFFILLLTAAAAFGQELKPGDLRDRAEKPLWTFDPKPYYGEGEEQCLLFPVYKHDSVIVLSTMVSEPCHILSIFGVDANTGKLAWRLRDTSRVHWRFNPVYHKDKLMYATDDSLYCFNVKDRGIVWSIKARLNDIRLSEDKLYCMSRESMDSLRIFVLDPLDGSISKDFTFRSEWRYERLMITGDDLVIADAYKKFTAFDLGAGRILTASEGDLLHYTKGVLYYQYEAADDDPTVVNRHLAAVRVKDSAKLWEHKLFSVYQADRDRYSFDLDHTIKGDSLFYYRPVIDHLGGTQVFLTCLNLESGSMVWDTQVASTDVRTLVYSSGVNEVKDNIVTVNVSENRYYFNLSGKPLRQEHFTDFGSYYYTYKGFSLDVITDYRYRKGKPDYRHYLCLIDSKGRKHRYRINSHFVEVKDDMLFFIDYDLEIHCLFNR